MHAYAKPFSNKVSRSLRLALERLRSRLRQNKPRRILSQLAESFFPFTDASLGDDGSGGIGGVLFDQSGSVVGWFSFLFTAEQT